MNIIVAILMFSVIVIVHELGHFLLAKKNSITVTEFSLGMGPRVISVVKLKKGFSMKLFASSDACNNGEDWKERTKYSIKLFPIGGSCIMLGEDELVDNENAFNRKSVWARISVVAAGAIFNFLLAFILSLIIIGSIGYDPAKILEVEENMPMSQAGIKAGDIITKIDSTKIDICRELSMYIHFNPLTDKEVNISYKRDGKVNTVIVRPILTEEGVYKLGFGFNNGIREKASPLNVVKYGFIEVKYWIKTTVEGLKQLILGKVNAKELAGPIGIVDMVGNVVEESKPGGLGIIMINVLNFSVLLSANLGVMNLLPLPALDGGRLVFLILEAIRKKPIDQEKEGLVHLVGLVALMILMVFVMFNDIGRIIGLQ